MPRFPHEYFSEGRAHAHLVIASVVAKSSSNADLREARRLLQRLVKAQSPAGQYRTLIVRESGTPELHCVLKLPAMRRQWQLHSMPNRSLLSRDGRAGKAAWMPT
jgi:hypothetical protein